VVGKKHNAVVATVVCLSLALTVQAQTPAPTAQATAPATSAPASTEKTFSQEELDQLVAPIALYPDALLAQALMASTYPLDVRVRGALGKGQSGTQGQGTRGCAAAATVGPKRQVAVRVPSGADHDEREARLDPEARRCVSRATGGRDEHCAEPAAKGSGSGSLQDSEQQKVITTQENSTTVIKIEPTKPEVVYVPTYNPTVVYGAWPYPAYPTYYYYPPGYVAGGALLGFTAGVIVGGALWGNCNWGRGDVNVNVNRYNNFNRTNVSNSNWQHNSDRRGAVPYRDQNVARQNGRGQSADAASRDAFRGRADSGARADPAR
jgi:hypothetical protein